MRARLDVFAIIVLTALAVLASAPLAGQAPTAAKATSAAEGVTDSELIVGMSAPFKGASRGLGIELYRGSRAYLDEVNRRGGVHGRRITIRAYDDGYQPEQAVKNTLKLMLEDKVFLLFDYVGTPTVTRVLPLLKKFDALHFLLFFPFTGAQPQREPPYAAFAVNLRASYRQETEGLVDNFLTIGRKRIAVFYQADAYGRSGWVGVRETLARRQMKIVGEATYARGTKFTESLDRQVAILQADQPDAIISVGAYEACAAFIRDARRAGLNVPIANVSFVGSESLLGLLMQQGREDGKDYTTNLVNSQVVPSYENLTMPSVREYRDLMTKYHPAPPADLAGADYQPLPSSFVSLEGFFNAKLLVEILERLGKDPTRAQVAAAVASVRDLDLGMGQHISFSAGRNQGADAIYYTTVEDGRFVPIHDWKEWSK
jgi:ABC-type branched-subunit amino acid transport system substrate-binding protein